MELKKAVQSKYFLYFIFFIAITNVISYLANSNYNAVALFVLSAFLSTYFTKNMVYILGIAIAMTNLAFTTNNYLEGMKNKKEKKEAMSDSKNGEKPKKKNNGKTKKEKEPQKQAFTQKNVPSSEPAPADEAEEDEEIGKRIDYASTLEQAYDNLQGILGDEGIQSLTKDTQSLISQQKQLMGTMQNMAPMLKMAKETLNNFSGDEMKETMGSLKGLLAGFGGNK
jgi:hypothetical protein